MRLFKILLFTLIAILTTVIIAFTARDLLTRYVTNHFLSKYDSEITCLEFNLDLKLNIDITKLCIKSAQANIDLTNTTLQWQFSPEIDASTIEIVSIKITSLNIRGKSELFSNKTSTQNKTKKELSIDDLPQYLQQVAQLTLPSAINVEQFSYRPFSLSPPITQNKTQSKTKPIYFGKFSTNKNTLSFSINNQNKLQQTSFLSAKLSSTGTDFTAELTTDLARLRTFLTEHKLTLPTEINDGLIIEGSFTSQIKWKDNELVINTQLKELSIDSEGIKQSGQLILNGTLNWQMHLINGLLKIEFAKHNEVKLAYNEKKLIELLLTQDISPKITPKITALLKDNPSGGLVVFPRGKVEVNLTESSLFIAEINVDTQNINQPSKLKLTELFFNFDSQKADDTHKNQATFSFDSQLNIAALNAVTRQPINIKAVGTIKQRQQGWHLQLTPETTVELIEIELTKTNSTKVKSSSKQVEQNKNSLTINKLNTQLQGDININQNGNLQLALKLNSQAILFHLNNIIQLEKLQLISSIEGNIDNINIDATVIADDVEVTTIKLNGELIQPQIQIFTNKLLLTDLFALKVNLPIPVKLIDGELSYHLKGQLTDLNNLQNNTAEFSISLRNTTGEINDIWIQDLQWQQDLIVTNGNIKTVDSKNNNLAIELIEIASPINNLSLKTKLSFNNKELSLAAKNIGGDILGGSFFIANTTWPINTDHSVNVQLTNIDLEKVLELDKKQGIVVTGKISGLLPIYFDGKNIIIKNGELHNISNGLIQVIDNPAVNELKISNSQLKLAFDALQNLHYHQLSSDVSMNDDGYMILETVIKGRNPDLDNDVNLNLNLSYDLLGLLESMSITERIEQNIIKDLQKH